MDFKMSQRLTPEREQEIREHSNSSMSLDHSCLTARQAKELLSEIAALRAEKEHQHKLKDEVEYDLGAMEQERDAFWRVRVTREDPKQAWVASV